jgi:cysteinyl-tRNA synthetase
MENKLYLYNTLNRRKELFEALNPPFVGLYVCGPTVYSDTHLGHARPAIIFDILFRYLKHLGYTVRYVRNITDVGHLENDADQGEDKISKKARLEQLEPMEIVQNYTLSYHHNMQQLNVQPPSIEPRASGHIIEQLQLIDKIIENGFAYESNGSVYFDVEAYNKKHQYGKLSGRVLDELLSYTRDLEGTGEKHSSYDFALWKKAEPTHIMRWPSRWSEGFPGWHLECSAMSTKYLGETFDIHGGGMDLMFPHHECEIAQSVAGTGKEAVRYWLHNNMITINGQKMARSLGNFITLNELFNGTHASLAQAYSPMTIRFFILQAHYRSTVDFSNEALQAAEKGLQRFMAGINLLKKLKPSEKSTIDVTSLRTKCYEAMSDDLNSPVVISHLFDGVRMINSINDGKESISTTDLASLQELFNTFAFEILGLRDEVSSQKGGELIGNLIDLLLKMRIEAKARKDFATSDAIRNQLNAMGVIVKDTKDGAEWQIE